MYNVLIADDEPVIRAGLHSFIDWEALGCRVVCEAGDGLEAKACLQQQPIDIAIVDIKMPGMNGIELCAYAAVSHPATQIILLSSYTEFDYAQSAIRYGVVDYVVKTNPTEKLPAAVERAKRRIEENRVQKNKLDQMEQAIVQSRYAIGDKHLKEALDGIGGASDAVAARLKVLDISLDRYWVIVYEVGTAGVPSAQAGEEASPGQALQPMLDFLARSYRAYSHRNLIAGPNLLVTLLAAGTHERRLPRKEELERICRENLKLIGSFFACSVRIGVSRPNGGAAGLPVAYRQAIDALAGNFSGKQGLAFYPDAAPEAEPEVHAQSLLGEFERLLTAGSVDAALERLRQIFEDFTRYGEPLRRAKLLSFQLNAQCAALLEGAETADAPGEPAIFRQIQDCLTLQSLFERMEGMLRGVAQRAPTHRRRQNRLVQEVDRYIRQHYGEDVTLGAIADHVHVNSSYLSRLYKRESGDSVIDALNRYRIGVARKMLKEQDKKVYEVALACGFKDAPYFTHVFTKYTGMNPKEDKNKPDGKRAKYGKARAALRRAP